MLDLVCGLLCGGVSSYLFPLTTLISWVVLAMVRAGE